MTAESSTIEWLSVQPSSVWLGSDEGRLSLHPINYSPRHEVQTEYKFEITKKAYSLDNLLESINLTENEFEKEGLRPPSEAEWMIAHSQGLIEKTEAKWEILADERPRLGYWGQRCDGQPRQTSYQAKLKLLIKWDGNNPETSHTTEVEPSQKGKEVTRLVRATEPQTNPPTLPNENKMPLLIRELLFALFIGIIPAFLWAYNFASAGYISEGWANIAFGGIFISLVSGFIWRPRWPSYQVSKDGNQMEKSRN
jgi:hypothetical protein